MDNCYYPLIIAFIITMAVLIMCVILYYPTKNTKYIEDTEDVEDFKDIENIVTKIMDDVPGVPTIELIEKTSQKSMLEKILGSVHSKIPFNIIKTGSDYSVTIPSYEDFNFAGKGLVIAASGNKYRYLTGLYCNLYVIRKYHKSNIPIEIFYVGKSEEFSPSIYKLITDLGGIKIYNIMDKFTTQLDESELRGYQTKPLAVVCSSFEEIVLVDADALCFTDPYHLFLADGYENSGMILFKDYVDCMSFISRDFIETIGIGVDAYCKYTNDFEIDSSCVVLNKSKCWDALYIICIVNVKSDSYHKSKNVLGDKDCWLICSMFVDFKPFISYPPPNVMVSNQNKIIIGHLQSTTFDNQDIFTHYNNQKIDLATIKLDGFTYSGQKNPKSGEECNVGLPLTGKIIDSFKFANDAMKILSPHIPSHLKNNIEFVNGICRGHIG